MFLTLIKFHHHTSISLPEYSLLTATTWMWIRREVRCLPWLLLILCCFLWRLLFELSRFPGLLFWHAPPWWCHCTLSVQFSELAPSLFSLFESTSSDIPRLWPLESCFLASKLFLPTVPWGGGRGWHLFYFTLQGQLCGSKFQWALLTAKCELQPFRKFM